jgi:ubiquinol-cytochrome c reductase iron-sulfur subunit
VDSEKSTEKKVTRRDFLYLTAAASGGIAACATLWPFVDSMNPSEDVLAVSTTEVDISSIKPGGAITVMWQGKPVFIRYRTPEEIKEARSIDMKNLPDPEQDQARIKKDQWLVVVGLCTHLGCVPIGQKATEVRGDFGGYFCPCHGSHYDTSGRIRKGPAPHNLLVPKYEFINDKIIRIG